MRRIAIKLKMAPLKIYFQQTLNSRGYVVNLESSYQRLNICNLKNNTLWNVVISLEKQL